MLQIDKDIIISRKIKISPESERYIHDDYFKGNEGHEYKLVDKLWDDIQGNCIIHMYPDSDTIDGNGESNGYESCLFFRTIIYNIDKMECYDFGRHDGIMLKTPAKVQHFKDMSTMITISDGCKIGNVTEFSVYGLL